MGAIGKAISTNRRTQERGAAGVITAEEWDAAQHHFARGCAYCGNRSVLALTTDHYVPLARGGGGAADNIVPACRDCNHRKGKHSPPELLARYMFHPARIAAIEQWLSAQAQRLGRAWTSPNATPAPPEPPPAPLSPTVNQKAEAAAAKLAERKKETKDAAKQRREKNKARQEAQRLAAIERRRTTHLVHAGRMEGDARRAKQALRHALQVVVARAAAGDAEAEAAVAAVQKIDAGFLNEGFLTSCRLGHCPACGAE